MAATCATNIAPLCPQGWTSRLCLLAPAEEIKGLLAELQPLYRIAVYVAAVTGLRVSELLALQWEDVSWDAMEIQLSRGIVHQHVGEMKTEASKRPLPLGDGLAEVLMDWRGQTPYNQHGDWIFASSEMQGEQPYGLIASCGV
jgi:integrase